MLTDEQHLLYAINAALTAGKVVEEIYDRGFDVEWKADNSPVTEADLAADKIIREQLEITKLPIISEEVEQLPYEERKGFEKYWCVDPIDGTIDFVKKTGNFCICIAQINNSRAYMGVIYLPIAKLLYYGINGKGGFKAEVSTPADKLEDLQPESLPTQKQPSDYTVLASRNHLNQRTLEYIEGLKQDKPDLQLLRVGSAIKFCRLADGLAHHYPRFGKMNDWDMAAGHAILEAAGGRIRTFEGNELLYNDENLYREDFMCWM